MSKHAEKIFCPVVTFLAPESRATCLLIILGLKKITSAREQLPREISKEERVAFFVYSACCRFLACVFLGKENGYTRTLR
jgi:hypothetical protein